MTGDKCPICGRQYSKLTTVDPTEESISVRGDVPVCRKQTTELRGEHGNWWEERVQKVFIHA